MILQAILRQNYICMAMIQVKKYLHFCYSYFAWNITQITYNNSGNSQMALKWWGHLFSRQLDKINFCHQKCRPDYLFTSSTLQDVDFVKFKCKKIFLKSTFHFTLNRGRIMKKGCVQISTTLFNFQISYLKLRAPPLITKGETSRSSWGVEDAFVNK